MTQIRRTPLMRHCQIYAVISATLVSAEVVLSQGASDVEARWSNHAAQDPIYPVSALRVALQPNFKKV